MDSAENLLERLHNHHSQAMNMLSALISDIDLQLQHKPGYTRDETHSTKVMSKLLLKLQSKGIWPHDLATGCFNKPYQPDDPVVNFSLYDNEQEFSISTIELIDNQDCLSRVEKSGAEGFYVEVIKWDDAAGWLSYAFCKFFELVEANYWCDRINLNAPFSKVFKTFPTKAKSSDENPEKPLGIDDALEEILEDNGLLLWKVEVGVFDFSKDPTTAIKSHIIMVAAKSHVLASEKAWKFTQKNIPRVGQYIYAPLMGPNEVDKSDY
jgi:hypothetical protein